MRKDFRDRFEVERALVDFTLSYEQAAQQGRHDGGEADEGQDLLDAVRSRVLASLPRAIDVSALAAEQGMSRSHFSHYFRQRTGLTPANYATQVRIHEATRMLIETRTSLKWIAALCGFANANHFSKVYRRFERQSPGACRRGAR